MSKAESHPLIEPFLDALWLERGLSDNTVSSYRTDLEKFALWLDEQGSSLLLAGMDEWNTRTHGESGLTQRVRESTIGPAEAEAQTIAFLEQWVPKGKSPICGNSIGQDRRFLYKYMQNLEAYFHYRYLDVSTLKILAGMWAPQVKDSFQKQGTHQALDDIRESIAELRHYRQHFLKV